MTRREKEMMIVANVIRILLAFSVIHNVFYVAYLNAFTAFLALVLTYLPSMLKKRWGEYMPVSLQFVIICFVFLSMFLGEIHGFYEKFWWWDKLLHFSSGILLGIIGFILVFMLNDHEAIRIRMSPFFVCAFAIMFAICMGVVWEIFEFTMDQCFGFNMQVRETGVIDTMGDLIVDTIGAIGVGFWGYYYSSFSRKIKKADAKTKLKNDHIPPIPFQ